MAGNPYTESGDMFQIPDMLANRADVYNLGDILHGKRDLFALSYLETALTSNALLAPMATREQDDVYKVIRMAKGESIPTTELSEIIAKLSNPRVDIEVHNQAPPGVQELLGQQVAIVERTLIPLVRTATENLHYSQAFSQQLVQIIELLQDLDHKLRQG